MHILVVDDEAEIRQVLRLLLENDGYKVTEARGGDEALRLLQDDDTVDLCIMDIMMPNKSGIETTRELRSFSTVPVLFLTARSFDSDKESAYSVGGDDYLVKPFPGGELLMKVKALIRRYNSYGAKSSDERASGIKLPSGVVVRPESRQVEKNGVLLELRDKEAEVLFYLVKNRGRVVGSDELYEAVWEELPLSSANNNITVQILNLRRKLEDNPSSPKVIRTVWGRGYQID